MSPLETAASNLAEFSENVREAGRSRLLSDSQVRELVGQCEELDALAKFYGKRYDLGRLANRFGRWRA